MQPRLHLAPSQGTAVRPLKYDPRSLMRRGTNFNTENNYSMAFFGKGKPALAHVPLEEEEEEEGGRRGADAYH